ncbi:MAG: FimV/HubP family polar landmark protein [Thiotrichales bacterium]
MRRLKLGLTISGLLAPTFSYALGLGEITTNSTLNQPLDADIELVSAAPGDVNEVKVRVAPDEVFRQVGIQRSAVVDQLAFKPTIVNGVPVIKVSSRGPVQEPFLNFVIEVVWSKGKLLREYTVLLDPPMLAGSEMQPAPAITTPRAAEPSVVTAAPPPIIPEAPTFTPAPIAAAPFAAAPLYEPEGLPPFVTTQAAPIAAAPTFEPAPRFEPSRRADGATLQGQAGIVSMIETYSVEELVGSSPQRAQPPQVATRSVEEFVRSEPTFARADEIPLTDVMRGDQVGAIDPAFGTDAIFVATPQAPARSADVGGGEAYTVRRGDTLHGIAVANRPAGVTVRQMMVSLYRQNPRAFVGNNMNRLRSGYVLRIPDATQVAQVSPRDANRQVNRQSSAWKEYRARAAGAAVPQTQVATRSPAGVGGITDLPATGRAAVTTPAPSGLEIIVPGKAGESAEGRQVAEAKPVVDDKAVSLAREKTESLTRENEELRSRVAELEALVSAKDRLIQLKDVQLTDLQKQLGAGAVDVTQPLPSSAQPAESVVAPDQGKGLLPRVEDPVTETAPPPIAEAPREAPKPAAQVSPVKADPQPSGEMSLMERLRNDPNLLMGGGLAALLLLALAWLVFRRKEEPEYEYADDRVRTVVTDHEPARGPVPQRSETVIADSDLDEERIGTRGADLEPERTMEIRTGDLTSNLDVGEEFAEEVQHEEAEEDEVISEANIYMAYGLHDQALDVLKPAAASHPSRTDYLMKLAEVYHALRDKSGFVGTAEKLQSRLQSSDPTAWRKIIAWGNDLDSNSAMFAGVDGASTSSFDQPTNLTPDYELGTGKDSWADEDAMPEGASTISLDDVDLRDDSYEEEKDPAGEFRLPDLDELSRSLQIERSGSLNELSLRDDDDIVDDYVERDTRSTRIDTLSPEDRLSLEDVEDEFTVLTTGADEMSTKLDLAKAYIDMGDDEGAREALEEVINQGTDDQRDEAEKLMAQLS